MNKKVVIVPLLAIVGVLGGVGIFHLLDKKTQDDDSSGKANFSVVSEFDESDYITKAPALTDTPLSIEGDSDGFSRADDVITITKPGEYTLNGDSDKAQIIVDVDKTIYSDSENDKVKLILNEVNLSNDNSPVIYVKSISDKVIIELSDGTENYITDSTNRDDEELKAAIFSQDDLNIKGTGSLTVGGNFQDGISSKNDIKIKEGVIKVTAVDDAIRGKDSVTVEGGEIIIKCGGDGIKSTETDDAEKGFVQISAGTLNISSYKDGIQAETNLDISEGEFIISTHKGADSSLDTEQNEEGTTEEISAKALKSNGNINITGGSFNINSTDDSIHANGDINISSGTFDIQTADDGVHSDGSITFDNASMTISKSYEGIEGLSIEFNDGYFNITSDDDAINASDGSSGEFGGGNFPNGGGFNGRQENMPEGGPEDMPNMPEGMPEDGEFNGGERPNMQEGLPENAQTQNTANVVDAEEDNEEKDISLTVNGGTIIINADGDGVDSNGVLTFNGGMIFVNGPTNSANGAIDCDGTITVNGGTIIALDSGGMSQGSNTEQSAQASLMVSVEMNEDEVISVCDKDGNIITSFKPLKDSAVLYYSSDKIINGDEYSILTGGSYDGGEDSDNILTSGVHKDYEKSSSTTAALTVAQNGMGGGKGGFGGFGRR